MIFRYKQNEKLSSIFKNRLQILLYANFHKLINFNSPESHQKTYDTLKVSASQCFISSKTPENCSVISNMTHGNSRPGVFLKMSQILHVNTCFRVSFLIKLQRNGYFFVFPVDMFCGKCNNSFFHQLQQILIVRSSRAEVFCKTHVTESLF